VRLKHLVWSALVLAAAGCDDAAVRPTTPAGPTPPTAPTAPAPNVGYSIRIVSGADGSPVRGATVVVAGRSLQSGDDGSVPVELSFGQWDLDVTAAGFLPRRTTATASQTIALWPVANDQEADAVRRMVYERGSAKDGVLYPPDSSSFYVTMLSVSAINAQAGSEAWSREARAFGSIFGLSYQLSPTFQYEIDEVAVTFSPAVGAGCVPVPAWGFCRDSPWYKSFTVLPEKALDPATIRRVLASWFLGPNPLPGFMNADAPADELSPLEIQTIRMILKRSRQNRWPDDDRW
jgi:hypothetical protein